LCGGQKGKKEIEGVELTEKSVQKKKKGSGVPILGGRRRMQRCEGEEGVWRAAQRVCKLDGVEWRSISISSGEFYDGIVVKVKKLMRREWGKGKGFRVQLR